MSRSLTSRGHPTCSSAARVGDEFSPHPATPNLCACCIPGHHRHHHAPLLPLSAAGIWIQSTAARWSWQSCSATMQTWSACRKWTKRCLPCASRCAWGSGGQPRVQAGLQADSRSEQRTHQPTGGRATCTSKLVGNGPSFGCEALRNIQLILLTPPSSSHLRRPFAAPPRPAATAGCCWVRRAVHQQGGAGTGGVSHVLERGAL